MITLLILLSSIIGYCFIAMLTYKFSAIGYLTLAYRKALPEAKARLKEKNKSDLEKELEAHKEALLIAKNDIETETCIEILSPLGAVFWPIGAPLFLLYFAFSWLNSKLSTPEIGGRRIKKIQAQIETERSRVAEWNKMLATAEDLGLDVKGLKRL